MYVFFNCYKVLILLLLPNGQELFILLIIDYNDLMWGYYNNNTFKITKLTNQSYSMRLILKVLSSRFLLEIWSLNPKLILKSKITPIRTSTYFPLELMYSTKVSSIFFLSCSTFSSFSALTLALANSLSSYFTLLVEMAREDLAY